MAINDDNDDWDPADIGMFAGFKVLNTHDFKDDHKNHNPANNGPYKPHGAMRKVCTKCKLEIGFIGGVWQVTRESLVVPHFGKVTKYLPTCEEINMIEALK